MKVLWDSKVDSRPCMMMPLDFVMNESEELGVTENTLIHLCADMKFFFPIYVKDQVRFTSLVDIIYKRFVKKLLTKVRDLVAEEIEEREDEIIDFNEHY